MSDRMDARLSAALKTGLCLWVKNAMEIIREHPEQLAELRKCFDGDGEVRVIYHVKANAITIETLDNAERTFTELFREQFVPGDVGFALPESDRKH